MAKNKNLIIKVFYKSGIIEEIHCENFSNSSDLKGFLVYGRNTEDGCLVIADGAINLDCVAKLTFDEIQVH